MNTKWETLDGTPIVFVFSDPSLQGSEEFLQPETKASIIEAAEKYHNFHSYESEITIIVMGNWEGVGFATKVNPVQFLKIQSLVTTHILWATAHSRMDCPNCHFASCPMRADMLFPDYRA